MKKVKFDFGDCYDYNGFTDGTTWNGFNNIWVIEKEYKKIIKHFNHINDIDESGLLEIIKDENGMYSLAYGFSTIIINTCTIDGCNNCTPNEDCELCEDCYEDCTRYGEEYNQLPNIIKKGDK
jgi:hypothetical protein